MTTKPKASKATKKAAPRKPANGGKHKKLKMVTVRLPWTPTFRALGYAKVDTGQSHQELIEAALAAYLPTVSRGAAREYAEDSNKA